MMLRYRLEYEERMRIEQRSDALLMVLSSSKSTHEPSSDLIIPSPLFRPTTVFRRQRIRNRFIGYGLNPSPMARPKLVLKYLRHARLPSMKPRTLSPWLSLFTSNGLVLPFLARFLTMVPSIVDGDRDAVIIVIEDSEVAAFELLYDQSSTAWDGP